MDRKHLLKRMGVTTLHGDFPAVLNEFISACDTKNKKLTAVFFSDEEFQLTEVITDIMMPPTSTSGALENQVPYFIILVVK